MESVLRMNWLTRMKRIKSTTIPFVIAVVITNRRIPNKVELSTLAVHKRIPCHNDPKKKMAASTCTAFRAGLSSLIAAVMTPKTMLLFRKRQPAHLQVSLNLIGAEGNAFDNRRSQGDHQAVGVLCVRAIGEAAMIHEVAAVVNMIAGVPNMRIKRLSGDVTAIDSVGQWKGLLQSPGYWPHITTLNIIAKPTVGINVRAWPRRSQGIMRKFSGPRSAMPLLPLKTALRAEAAMAAQVACRAARNTRHSNTSAPKTSGSSKRPGRTNRKHTRIQ
mmetsp:Transcript_128912/g.223596  ORF Transcript_128912/g.223596 Transcript_128912/m.223596 type:complete len:274 (-) Transcript_128912:789-1610(-)